MPSGSYAVVREVRRVRGLCDEDVGVVVGLDLEPDHTSARCRVPGVVVAAVRIGVGDQFCNIQTTSSRDYHGRKQQLMKLS